MLKLRYKNQNFEIDEVLNTCIFSKDKKFLNDFLKKIAGINKSDFLIDEKNVYENEEYFKNRIYIDNNLEYINTLNANKISNILLNNFSKVFLEEDFKRLMKETNLRSYSSLNNRDKFNKIGNVIANNVFALSIMSFRIIYDAFKYINDNNVIKILKNEYITKPGNLFSSHINNLGNYKDFLHKIIIINKKVFIFDSKSSVLLLDCKLSEKFDDEIIYENRHYYYRCELLKNYNFMQEIKSKKYRIVSLYEMGEDYD